MKTIAITIDDETLEAIDKLARPGGKGRGSAPGNRSKVVREALREFLAQREKAAREEAEWKVWSKRIDKLNREAAALVAEQAEP
ncbi:MAG TPA: ribbon-helix-helix domain-containing protein [Myxococcales bacterium]|jgi:metal-responsive CopG/Arc/MetJ family transcriptional regulator